MRPPGLYERTGCGAVLALLLALADLAAIWPDDAGD